MNANSKTEFVNVPSVTVDQARELMLHHLGLAAGYLAVLPATDQETIDIRTEVDRVFDKEDSTIRNSINTFCHTILSVRASALKAQAKTHENKRPAPAETMEEPALPPPEKHKPMVPHGKLGQGARDASNLRELTDAEVAKLKGRGLKPLTVNQQVACNVLGVPCVRRGRGLYVRIGV